MACPTCGSTSYVLISPGVAECAGSYLHPTGAHPSGAMGPTHQPVACGTRFQVPNTSGGQLPYCECGMQAVARCVECGVPLCLDHAARVQGGVLCATHYEERRQAAVAAEERAFDDGLQRLRMALRRLPDAVSDVPADLRIQHDLGKEAVSGLEPGDGCPRHRSNCRIYSIASTGKLIKKVHGGQAALDAWVLRHRCYVHSDIHGGPSRSDSNGVEILAVSATGELHRITTYRLPIDTVPHGSRSAITADSPRLAEALQGDANLEGMRLPAFLSLLADAVERVSSGVTRAGSANCRR